MFSRLVRYRRLLLWLGIILVVVPTLLHAYTLMPFPGSQTMETMELAYILEQLLLPTRILGALLLLVPVLDTFMNGRLRGRIGMAFLCLFLVGIVYMASTKVRAEVMFREPETLTFLDASRSRGTGDSSIVIGVAHNGVAKAYPVTMIGYHHKVQDSVGGRPVLVTYCTMCRTGRVYNPIIDGAERRFRLVGARHYNAIIEDDATRSWWYQATGEAAMGPKKGSTLEEIPSEQMTLGAWRERHPGTLVMQPDPAFAASYEQMEGYDRDLSVPLDSATRRPVLWSDRGWVVGVELNRTARAYEWSDLRSHRVINDTLGGAPVVLTLEPDTMSFHVWKRSVDGTAMEFTAESAGRGMVDRGTGSLWNWKGEAVEGTMTGRRLERVAASQEYWRSWRTFHPTTSRWGVAAR